MGEELYNRQKNLQKTSNRSKTINMYKICTDMDSDVLRGVPLDDYIKNIIKENGEFVYSDFGSGNDIAIREMAFSIGISLLVRYSVDILEIDSVKRMKDQINMYANRWRYDDFYEEFWSDFRLNALNSNEAVDILLQDKYAPIRFQGDVSTIKLPKKADLITCIDVLQYNDDPFVIIDNALDNLKSGGIFVCNTAFTDIKDEFNFIDSEHRAIRKQ